MPGGTTDRDGTRWLRSTLLSDAMERGLAADDGLVAAPAETKGDKVAAIEWRKEAWCG